MKKPCLLAAVTALALGACTEGPSYTEATAVASPIPAGQGRIAIYRSQKVMGFGVTPVVLVDGRPTGNCQVNSVFFVNVPPGSKTLVASTTQSSVTQINVAPGKTSYVQCTIEVGPVVGIPKLVEVNAAAATTKVQGLIFTGQY